MITDHLAALGKQNGAVIADYVIARLRAGTISPAEAVDALKAYIAKRVNETTSKGVAREELRPWIEAVEQAFDERLAELAGPEDVRKQPEG